MQSSLRVSLRRLAAVVLVFELLLIGCRRAVYEPPKPPTPVVSISQPVKREVTDFVDFTGRTDAVSSVDVRARVTGYIVQMPFKEGAEIKAGDLLFEIDPRPYQAKYDHAIATLQLSQAQLKLDIANNIRARNLAEKTPNAITQQDLDTYQASEEKSRASVADSKANLDSAKLDLEFTKVTSPINGQVSRYFLTLGNLVTQDQTLLTTVVSLDPIYMYFDIDEATILRIKGLINEGKIKPIREVGSVPVYMGLQSETGFPHLGSLNFVNNRIDPTTGTVTVRATFDNPLTAAGIRPFGPGMFVRVHLPLGKPHEALLVVDQAIGTDQGLKFVYVINEKNGVEYRRVRVGPLEDDGLRVIEEGVGPDDWVVVAGLQQIRPKMVVETEKIDMPRPAAPAVEQQSSETKPKASEK